jgi:hypothetical protein
MATEYVAIPPKRQAIQWDGTNQTEVETMIGQFYTPNSVAVSGTSLLVSDSAQTLTVPLNSWIVTKPYLGSPVYSSSTFWLNGGWAALSPAGFANTYEVAP